MLHSPLSNRSTTASPLLPFPLGRGQVEGEVKEKAILKRFPSLSSAFLISTATLLVVGCSGNLPRTAVVRGIVELDGSPLTGFDNASVLLTPRAGRMATGVVQPDGTFELGTFADGDGAIPGPAHVAVTATVDDPNAKNIERGIGVRWIIPSHFGGDDSGLSCEVVPGKENVFRIQLTSSGEGSIAAAE